MIGLIAYFCQLFSLRKAYLRPAFRPVKKVLVRLMLGSSSSCLSKYDLVADWRVDWGCRSCSPTCRSAAAAAAAVIVVLFSY